MQQADATDKHMEEFFREVTAIKVRLIRCVIVLRPTAFQSHLVASGQLQLLAVLSNEQCCNRGK